MKLSNEVKVGILAITAIVLLVLGFNFLKGSQIFSKPFVLYARFTDIGSLEKSNQVKINGMPIGTVYEYKPADQEVNSIIVEIHVDKQVNIPANTVAIIDGTILGSPFINLLKEDQPSNIYYQNGDTLKTRIDPTLMSDLKAQIAPTIIRLNETFDSLKVTISKFNTIFDLNTQGNLRSMVANLNVASAELTHLLSPRGPIGRTFEGVDAITGNLARNNAVINNSLRNVETVSSNLAAADIQGTVATLQATINEMRATVARLNSKEGSLGLLMNDRQLHDRLQDFTNRLNTAALSAEILMDDIRIHPKRYVNFSLFGGGNKGEPLTSPTVKDTIPR